MYLVKPTQTTQNGLTYRLIKISRENRYVIQAWWACPYSGWEGWVGLGSFDEKEKVLARWNAIFAEPKRMIRKPFAMTDEVILARESAYDVPGLY